MGARRIFLFDAPGGFVHGGGGSLNGPLFAKMALFVTSCWFFACNSMLRVIGFVATYFLRFRAGKTSRSKSETSFERIVRKEGGTDSGETEPVPDVIDFEKTEYDGFEEREETPRFSFKFQFESPEEIRRKIEECSEEHVQNDSTNVQLYRFLGEGDFVGFVREPEVFNLRVEYSYPDTGVDSRTEDARLSEKEISVQKDNGEESVPSFEFDSRTHVAEEKSEEPWTLVDDQVSIKESLFELSLDELADREDFDEALFLSQRDFVGCNSDLESLGSYIEISAGDHGVEVSDEFLSEGDFTGAHPIDFEEEEEEEEEEEKEDTHLQKSCNSEKGLIELNPEMSRAHSPCTGSSSVVPQRTDSNPCEERNPEGDSRVHDKTEESERVPRTEEEAEASEGTDLESSTDSDSLWEHQDLIEQLRMELKKVRAIGLPTILEESESPKTMDDLKPWKFEEKFLQEDPMNELQKFYKSYRERMRKFDILNYQKMYAIGFLQLKTPFGSKLTKKSTVPTLASLLSRRRKEEDDPSEKLIRELQSDLETVYVGQTCLSWEILQHQLGKARESDGAGAARSYNQVAGEFQQFQVVLRRFLENEEFEGPRVQNYVKSRCVLRNLLQVPTIREDSFKDRKEERRWRRENPDVITCRDLITIVEESMRIMWEFIKADKGLPVAAPAQTEEFQDPSHLQLFLDVHTHYQKKEKKLKDLARTGQCLVKRFQKQTECDLREVTFLAQVDIRLVGRALRMRRVTTDQLMWCEKKLSRVAFSDRKIYREPSFLLFPC